MLSSILLKSAVSFCRDRCSYRSLSFSLLLLFFISCSSVWENCTLAFSSVSSRVMTLTKESIRLLVESIMVVTHAWKAFSCTSSNISNVRFCSASAASTAAAVVSHGSLPSLSGCDADAPRRDLLSIVIVWIVIQRNGLQTVSQRFNTSPGVSLHSSTDNGDHCDTSVGADCST